jgi:hypothetical protein
MPLNRTPLTGNQIVAMANVSLQRNYTLTGQVGVDTSFTLNELNVLGLPSLMYWVRLNSGVNNIVFTPLFAVQNTTTGGLTAPDWLPFTNGAVLVPGNIFVFTIRASAANAAAQFSIPGGIAPISINVDVVISAGG